MTLVLYTLECSLVSSTMGLPMVSFLIMCILLIETFLIQYMHSRMPISLFCNSLNMYWLSKTL